MSAARDEITRLIYEYAERLDLGDFAGVGALFAHASYGVEGQTAYSGADAVRKALGEFVRLHDASPRTKHVTTNLVIDVDEAGAVASARSYFSVFQQVGETALEPIAMGRYRDRFERDPSGRHFVERRIYMDLVGHMSRHLHRSPPGS